MCSVTRNLDSSERNEQSDGPLSAAIVRVVLVCDQKLGASESRLGHGLRLPAGFEFPTKTNFLLAIRGVFPCLQHLLFSFDS